MTFGKGRDPAGATIAGRYELRDRLGRGGMATVYRAYQPALDRFVAIKLIDPGLADEPTFIERFRLEARIAARLRHPHILTIYDFGEEGGTLYLVTELIAGGTLQDRLDRDGAFDRPLDVVEQVGRALDHAHAQGIVHRDVKPANVFLEGERAILADFGIAKVLAGATGAGLTATGVGIGTPEYVAPEQVLGGAIDGRADLYALGVMLYRLLAGRLPFRLEGPDDTALALVMRKVNSAPPPPSALNPALPPALDAVLLRALAREPAARYPTAAAFCAAAREVLGPHGATATPGRHPGGTPATALPISLDAATRPIDAATAPSPPAPTPPAPNTPPPYQIAPPPPAFQPAAYGPAPSTVRPGRGPLFAPLMLAATLILLLAVGGGAFAVGRLGGDTSGGARGTETGPGPTASLGAGLGASPSPAPSPIASLPPTIAATLAATVPPTQRPPTAVPSPPAGNVAAVAQGAILSLPGTSSGVFINLSDPADGYADEPDRVMPAASLIKLPIAGAVYGRIADGQWRFTDRVTLTDEVKVGGTGILREQPAGTSYTLDQLVEIMLLRSDNTAANMLLDRLGGFDAVNSFSASQGMNNTVMRRRLYDLAAQGRGVENTTTSGDIARFFTRLQAGQVVGPTVSERLRTILARRGQDDRNWALLNLPPGTVALHMTGTGAGVRNDAILVTAGQRQYILVLMVNDPGEAAMEAAITRASATIYRAVAGP